MSLELIGAGLGRTGTFSLKLALEQLGFGPCYHMSELLKRQNTDIPLWDAAADGAHVDWKALFAGYQSAVDFPSAAFYRELAECFPHAKVVLTVRDPEQWFKSYRETIRHVLTGPAPQELAAWTRMVRNAVLERVFRGNAADKSQVIASFEAHNRAVQQHIPASRLLVYEVSQGWEPLCSFLGVSAPKTAFPTSNNTETWVRKYMPRSETDPGASSLATFSKPSEQPVDRTTPAQDYAAFLQTVFARDRERLLAASAPPDLKRQILKTYARLLAREVDSEPTAQILNFQVKAFRIWMLTHLFRSIFVLMDYYFAAGTKSPQIIDAGGNIGMATLFFKTMYPDAYIHAIEPDPGTFNLLRENVLRNSLGNVSLHNVALGPSRGVTPFYTDPELPGSLRMSTVRERMPKREDAVRMAPLSDFVTGEVDFLKLDIEGAEMDVLSELADSGKLRQVRQMVIEYHHHIRPSHDSLASFLSILEKAGFGYQLSAESGTGMRASLGRRFQDVLIYAYRK